MRTLKALTFAVAATGLALGGVAHAQATHSVQMLPTSSVAKRGSAPAAAEANVAGKGKGLVIALGVAALAAVAVLIAVDGKDKADTPG